MVWVVSLLVRDKLMSPNFRMVHRPLLLSKVYERRVPVRFGRFIEPSGVLPTTQFVGKVWVPVMHFCVDQSAKF